MPELPYALVDRRHLLEKPHQLEVALEPILKQLMVERGANMVVDRSAVILSTVDIDVTPVAVQRLDKTLPHVKVELTPVPAGAGK